MQPSNVKVSSPKMAREHFITLTLLLIFALGFTILFRPAGASSTAVKTGLDLSRLSLSFVPNQGQTAPAVRYQVHDLAGTIFLTNNEVVLSLPGAKPAENAIIRLHYQGANEAAAVTGVDKLPGTVSYFLGSAAAWHTGLPTYAGVVYHSLYQGIDLSYNGTSGAFKGAYTVAAHADPSQIRWSHFGAKSVTVNAAGALVILLDNGARLVEEAPVAWQVINGKQIPVSIQYAQNADGSFGFALGAYDANQVLTIDPTLVYSTFLGGSKMENAQGIAVDGTGAIYLTGSTGSTTFPGNTPTNLKGTFDAYVLKINADGQSLANSAFYGGNGDDEGAAIAVDAGGNAYITGDTDSTDLATMNAYQSACKIGSWPPGGECIGDAFVAKFNSSGTLAYGTYLGGDNPDLGTGIAVDASGKAVITGTTFSSNYPVKNAIKSAPSNNLTDVMDAILTEIDTTQSGANSLVFSTRLGGSSTDGSSHDGYSAINGVTAGGAAVALGTDGIYVTGQTTSTDFPLQNPLQSSMAGADDVFISKVSLDGSHLLFSTYLGGAKSDHAYGLALDGTGNAYVTGNTESANFPVTNAVQTASAGLSDAFVTAIKADGSGWLYSTYLGGTGADYAYGIAADSAGTVYVAGNTASVDFPSSHTLQGYAGNGDAFVTKLVQSADVPAIEYSTFLGGADYDSANAIAVDLSGKAYVAGQTKSSDFPTKNPLQASYSGEGDVFVAVIDSAGDVPIATPGTPAPTMTPYPTPTFPPMPNESPLIGSYKYADSLTLSPGQTLTYTIVLHNSGTTDTTADVVDRLPAHVDYVDGSASNGAVYDSTAHSLTWTGVAISAGGDVRLTYQVTTSYDQRFPAINVATITDVPSGKKIVRPWAVMILPSTPPSDQTAPEVTGVHIGDQDVLTDPNVTLHITATDNVGVSQMYVEEWALNMDGGAHWASQQKSGWVPFQADYPWTLSARSGPHFVGVWVKDAAGNRSFLDRDSLDYASLVLPSQTLTTGTYLPYMVHYDQGTAVIAALSLTSGDADLYAWYPGNFGTPDQVSDASKTISFTAPKTGLYIILVYAKSDATYALSITPAGGPNPWPAITSTNKVAAQATGLTQEPAISRAGIDPLQSVSPGAPGDTYPYNYYIPVIGILSKK